MRFSAHAARATIRYVMIIWGVSVALLVACGKDETTRPSQIPILSDLTAPQVVSPGQTLTITIKATDPQGVKNVLYVTVEIYRPDAQTPLATDTLFDDGAYYHPGDGDVVAGDGIFSGRLVWRWSGTTDETYRLVFKAIDADGNMSEPLEHTIIARKNDAPIIVELQAPAELPSGFTSDFRFRALVADSQGLSDVTGVHYVGLRGLSQVFEGQLYDDGSHGDPTPGDGWFELRLTPAFSAGRKGEYLLRFWAVDRAGAQSPKVDRSIVLQNEPPEVQKIDMPDSVTKPATGSTAARIRATVVDPQSVADVKSVGFLSRKPDGSFANNGQPIPMVDNGLPFDPSQYPQPYYGDEVAGDGIYTFTIIVYSDEEATRNGLAPVQTGTYTFIFQAEDWVGQKSQTVERTFVVR